MASKRMDLQKRCFYIQSGVSNVLGKTLAMKVCKRFEKNSLVLLIDYSEEHLQEVKKELLYENQQLKVVCFALQQSQTPATLSQAFQELLAAVLSKHASESFELAFVLHNEGDGATALLQEPQSTAAWKTYVEQNLYAAVALNQAFLKQQCGNAQKLVVNISSSLMVQPLFYSSLWASCKKARDMYFRAMADEETRRNVVVLSYSPGILSTHQPQNDENNNIIDLHDLGIEAAKLKQPRVKPCETVLKLLNILEEMSFISGHDVDYYDTYVL